MTPFQAWRRRLRAGLPTVLGLNAQGFFIPYRYAGDMPPSVARRGYPASEALLDAGTPGFEGWLKTMDGYADGLLAIGDDAPAPAPRWYQDWFPRLDGAMAYTMARRYAPRRIVEIGSGHSTRFFARAVKDGALATEILAIDPAPRAVLDGLSSVTLDRRTVQEAGLSPFEGLTAGDILAIDSSHILMPGSDVDLLLNTVLPILPAGVVVHFHDIFLPDAYPAEWDWRGYNEQLGVAALLAGGAWQVLFGSHHVVTRMSDAVRASVAGRLPLLAGAMESSLWLEKRA
ncbi:MAG: class I SAM-dependent methyltransferase [Alphaproteobacteria bacterium]